MSVTLRVPQKLVDTVVLRSSSVQGRCGDTNEIVAVLVLIVRRDSGGDTQHGDEFPYVPMPSKGLNTNTC